MLMIILLVIAGMLGMAWLMGDIGGGLNDCHHCHSGEHSEHG